MLVTSDSFDIYVWSVWSVDLRQSVVSLETPNHMAVMALDNTFFVQNLRLRVLIKKIITRPDVARAVLQTPSSLNN